MFTQLLRSTLEYVATKVFPSKRTADRMVEHAMTLACLSDSRTISHVICASGRDQEDWSAEYKMFSRSRWDVEAMYDMPLEYSMQNSRGSVVIAVDDTKLKKTGSRIPGVTYQRDPMSPPFHPNFIRASRYLQAAAVVDSGKDPGARTLPVAFREVPVVKKPGKRASPSDIAAWKERKKAENLSVAALKMCRDTRRRADELGAQERSLLVTLDGSFCNRTIFCASVDRVDFLARCRSDAKLAYPSAKPNRVYDEAKFTPEEARKDEQIPWTGVDAHYGGQLRRIRCKQIPLLLWQGGAKRRPLRLIIIAAQPYRTSPNSRLNYRQCAYYLTTDLQSPLQLLVQAALDRWQIEVNNREEKTGFGVGEAQLRSSRSVPRHPAFAVAVYSIMHMCALSLFGPTRTTDYLRLPKWRRKAKRPSISDLKALLVRESQNQPRKRSLQIKNQQSITPPTMIT